MFGLGSPTGAAPSAPIDWVEAYTREALAAPISLENALQYRWYQIGVSVRAQHPSVYNIDIAAAVQRLRRHGDAVTEDLKRQLDTRFANVLSLETAGPAPALCSWIMARERGEGLTQLQIDLDRHCREVAAPALYSRLVRERAAQLDVRLATLPHLTIAYPGRLIGTPAFVGHEDVAGAFAQALDRRLTAAQAGVIDEIRAVFAARVVGDELLMPQAEQCREMLGGWYPQGDAVRALAQGDLLGAPGASLAVQHFGATIGEICIGEASAWLLRQRPAIGARIQERLAALDPAEGPIISVETRCSGLLARWFSRYGGVDTALTSPLREACRRDASALNNRSVTLDATRLAARFESAPRTLDGLEQHGWFEPTALDIQGTTDPADPGRGEIEGAVREAFAARVGPWLAEAKVAARAELAAAYERSSASGGGASPTPKRCAPYLGEPGRSLPTGGGDLRAALTKACRDLEDRAVARRVQTALTEANATGILGVGRLLVSTPEGRSIVLDPRAVVAAAALNDLQVTFTRSTSWTFQSRTEMRITPLGRTRPTLHGTVTPETRPDGVPVWRIGTLDDLPGLDGPLATLSCATLPRDETLASEFKVGAGVLVGMAFDAPHTAGALIGDGLTGLIAVEGCDASRRTFLADAPR